MITCHPDPTVAGEGTLTSRLITLV